MMRICNNCGKIITGGYYCIDDGLEYYCSDDCIDGWYSPEEQQELYEQELFYWSEVE